MKHDIKTLRQGIINLSLLPSFLFALALFVGAQATASAQGSNDSSAKGQSEESKETKEKPDAKEQKGKKDDKAANQQTTRVSAGGRDPFSKYRIVKKPAKNVPVPVAPPTIQSRIERYKEQKRMAMNLQQPAPKPTTALLLSEMQVIGIFRTPRGYAAMVEATPIKLSYTIYPGERFFDGQLVAIEEDRLVFRRETRWSDGHLIRAVETKPLRQPSTVADPLAAASKDAKGSSGEAAQSAEKPASPDKQ